MDIKTVTAASRITADNNNQQILYEQSFADSAHNISFRELKLPEDLNVIHTWTNQPSSKAFWSMEKQSEADLLKEYTAILKSPFTHSFIGLLNKKPVCLINIYIIAHDELRTHVKTTGRDFGIHFLMSQSENQIHNLSVCCMQTFLSFLFSDENISNIYGEPDVDNDKANQLVVKAGFSFLRTITLSYKTANLYRVTRHDFSQVHLYNI